MTAGNEDMMAGNEEPRIRTVDALCRLSERCHVTAKFSERRAYWYEKSEQYVAAACGLMDKAISGLMNKSIQNN